MYVCLNVSSLRNKQVCVCWFAWVSKNVLHYFFDKKKKEIRVMRKALEGNKLFCVKLTGNTVEMPGHCLCPHNTKGATAIISTRATIVSRLHTLRRHFALEFGCLRALILQIRNRTLKTAFN